MSDQDHKPRGLTEDVRRIGRDAGALSGSVRDTMDDFGGFLAEQVNQHPYTTVAVAAALGYVVGGGVSSRLRALLLGVGTRLAIAVAARELAIRLERHDTNQPTRANGPHTLRGVKEAT